MASDDTRQRAIVAVFGSETVTFALSGDHHAARSLDAVLGSPWAALQRLSGGRWTVEDVRMTLAHAYPGTVPLARLTRAPAVDAVLSSRPVAPYALLALRVLEAFLMGVEAAQARFDEAAAP